MAPALVTALVTAFVTALVTAATAQGLLTAPAGGVSRVDRDPKGVNLRRARGGGVVSRLASECGGLGKTRG